MEAARAAHLVGWKGGLVHHRQLRPNILPAGQRERDGGFFLPGFGRRRLPVRPDGARELKALISRRA